MPPPTRRPSDPRPPRNWPAILALAFGVFVLAGFLFQSPAPHAEPPAEPPAPAQPEAPAREPTPGEVARQQAAFWVWPFAMGMNETAAGAGQLGD